MYRLISKAVCSGLLLLFAFAAVTADDGPTGMRLRIALINDPPYQSSWLPWIDDQFRVEFTITNLTDSNYSVYRASPCNDCNPLLFVRDVITITEPERTVEKDVLYRTNEESFVNILANETYTDTIDFARYINYDLESGKLYQVWLEYNAWGSDFEFSDSSAVAPVWLYKMVSDTVEFVY